MFDHRKSRKYTSALMDALDQGMLDKDSLIQDLLGWLSEDEVEQFVRANDLMEAVSLEDEDEDEEEWTPDNADFNDPGSRHHY